MVTNNSADIVERLRQFAAFGDTPDCRIMAQLALTEIERLCAVPPCPGCDGHECDDGCQYPLTTASGEAATPSNGDAQIRRAAEETAPKAQIVRTDGDLLVYYSGFNLSKFVRFLALQPHVVSQDGAAQPVVATAELTGADLGRWCYENPNLAARTIEGLRGVAQARPDCKAACDGQMQLAMAEIERLEALNLALSSAQRACQVCGETSDLKCGPSRFGAETWACKDCWDPEGSTVTSPQREAGQ